MKGIWYNAIACVPGREVLGACRSEHTSTLGLALCKSSFGQQDLPRKIWYLGLLVAMKCLIDICIFENPFSWTFNITGWLVFRLAFEPKSDIHPGKGDRKLQVWLHRSLLYGAASSLSWSLELPETSPKSDWLHWERQVLIVDNSLGTVWIFGRCFFGVFRLFSARHLFFVYCSRAFQNNVKI